jgi:hypothetical protein
LTVNSDAIEELNVRSDNGVRPQLPDRRNVVLGQDIRWKYQVRPTQKFKATKFDFSLDIENAALGAPLPLDLTGEIKPQSEAADPGWVEKIVIPNLTKILTGVLSAVAGAVAALLVKQHSERRGQAEPEAEDDDDDDE